MNGGLYPGLLPEPVTLIGTDDGAVAGPWGNVLYDLETEVPVGLMMFSVE